MIALSVIGLLIVIGVLYFIFGPKEYPGDDDVVIEVPISDIPIQTLQTAPQKVPIIIHEEHLSQIPVHKVIKAKVKKVIHRKKAAKKK